MPSVLGIDAAWTEGQPSGVALLTGCPGNWRCAAVAPSYKSFLALTATQRIDWEAPKFEGGIPCAAELLAVARKLGNADVDIVAVDMPLATLPILKRREADSAISREFGKSWCSTHSPSPTRPGPLSDRLRTELEASGFRLATHLDDLCESKRLVEVYPHVALLQLLSAARRLECKASKISKYWPGKTRGERVANLLGVWKIIWSKLATEISDLPQMFPSPESVRTLTGLKRYEDALDAVVSAWVGAKFLEGQARPCGDHTAAIWVPVLSPEQTAYESR